jgi:glycosyltransferase involved in cell wall biosynthesis
MSHKPLCLWRRSLFLYRSMKFLFVHQNFPGQYVHLVRHLASVPGNEVVFITQRKDGTIPGVKKIVYAPSRKGARNTHHYLQDTEAGVLNAQAVARVALDLKKAGFVPDLMLGHNGWGEIWYLKDVYPNTPLLGFFEFFYRANGADVGFDPTLPKIFDDGPRIRTKNLGNLLGLDACDLGQCPTQWQKSVFPQRHQSMLHLVHDGIDTSLAKPDPRARLKLPDSEIELAAGDEVVTYVARNLEPYRGFPSFMRSLPAILSSRPQAQVVIVGGDETSYGAPLPGGLTYRQKMLDELGDGLDLKRVHFLGKVPYPTFLKVLQVSKVHVYLTYPFVLSWSMLEAMSAGCVVVGSRTAPVQEVIRDGESGYLVDFFKPQEIAERVIDVLKHRSGLEAIRENARCTVVQRYDLRSICLPAQLQLLERLLPSSPRKQEAAMVEIS